MAGGQFGASGDAQFSQFLQRGQWSDNSPHELVTPERYKLEDETTYIFRIFVCGRTDEGTEAMKSHREVVVERHGGDATKLDDHLVDEYQTDGSWSVAIAVDNGGGTKYLTITVTGNSENIRWVALIEAVEIIYS